MNLTYLLFYLWLLAAALIATIAYDLYAPQLAHLITLLG